MSTNNFSTDFLETPWWIQHQNMMETSIKTSSRRDLNTFNSSSNNNTLWANNSRQVNHPVNATNTMFCTQNTAFGFNLNHEDDEDLDENLTDDHIEKEEEEIVVKEALFEKPLTPSDVGKLNRLVIPKQHAEKYFPLSGGGGGGVNESGEKGLLLSFEDESGKLWRFRYSYWNSSQSYVLTKGWSRFVKEKKLNAGDIVLFERHQNGGDRFFIGCRRKGTLAKSSVAQPVTVVTGGGGSVGGGSRLTPGLYSGHPYPLHVSEAPYQGEYPYAGSVVVVQKAREGASGGNSKRLRLFGVNLDLECQHESHPSTPDHASSLSTLHHHFNSNSHAANHHQTHMQDFNFSTR